MNKYIQTYNTTAEYEAGTKENPNVSFVVDTNTLYYDGERHDIPIDYSAMYLTFKAKTDGTFKFSGSTTANTLSYSLDDGSTWVALANNTDTPTVTSGSKILWKGTCTPQSGNGIGMFTSTAQFEVVGNVMSLVSGDSFTEANSVATYQFYRLFVACAGLTSAENLVLPATTLASNCYSYMFAYCASLTTAPELPATTLADSCYSSMFDGCIRLTTAPELPATTLATSCCSYMFNGCTSLTTAPELHATTLTYNCYGYMFKGCTGLTTVPELPATTLVGNCYRQMFEGCSNLNYIKCMATDISAVASIYGWVNGVAASGTFVKNASMTSWPSGADGIPTGWTVVDA